MLTPIQRGILSGLARSRTHGAALVVRSTIVLEYMRTKNKSEVVRSLGSTQDIVGRWVARWQEEVFQLCQLEETCTRHEYTQEIIRALSDVQRPGAPPRITEEQKQQIIALATEKPSDHGVPVTQWSHELLARAAMKEKIVPRISSSHIGRFLKAGNTQAA